MIYAVTLLIVIAEPSPCSRDGKKLTEPLVLTRDLVSHSHDHKDQEKWHTQCDAESVSMKTNFIHLHESSSKRPNTKNKLR